VFRKRHQPTPHFRLPPPYNPVEGEEHKLLVPGVYPYVAMVQIAVADTKRDYVKCRGFDIRVNRFVDYPPGISVAKPYGNRVVGVYQVAQVYPAILPLQTSCSSPVDVPWRVGQNPGVAAVTPGHPADLNEEIEVLYDDDGIVIAWMMADGGAQPWYLGKVITSAITAGSTGTVRMYNQAWSVTSPAVDFTVYNPHDVDLPVDLKVRWGRYPGWTGWVVEPWHFTEC